MEWYGSNIRQKPGYDNALGWIKFLFPNRYNIYMHDTPNKYLFEKNIRTFSHGCIRLENAKKLAVYLLRNTKNWNSTTIDDFIQKKQETKIKLNSRIPVYIVYRTAWVDKDGKLNLRKDIYGKDKLLLNWLDRKSVTNN
jgi:murein L,D-transpeptidase YcbB/YkuD